MGRPKRESVPDIQDTSEEEFDRELYGKSVENVFGKNTIKDLKEMPKKGEPGTFIPSPSLNLNLACGMGGFPRGRIIEISGPEGGGKSTLALEICKAAQDMFPRKPILYIDAEQALNIEYCDMIGLDTSTDRFLFNQDQEAEKVLDLADFTARQGASVIVVDSISGLTPKKELESPETTDMQMGGISRHLSNHLRRIAKTASDTGCLVVYISQLREKLGIVFGNPETTTGGRSLKFWATMRLDVRVKEQIKDKEGTPLGHRTKVKFNKNKVSAPYRVAEYDLIYGKGIDKLADLVDTAADKGLIEKSGAWYKYAGKNVANGRDQCKTWLENNPEIQTILRDTVWSQE